MKVPFSVDLTGKTAIVTGGSGVLCSAMAYGLAVNGAKVAIIGRNKEKLAKMSETLTENAKNEYSKEVTVKGYSAFCIGISHNLGKRKDRGNRSDIDNASLSLFQHISGKYLDRQ